MDGTLLDDEKRLPSGFPELMTEYEKRGVIFGIGSGRQYETLRRMFPGHEERMIFISDNGSITFYKNKCLWVEEIPEDMVLKVLSVCRENGFMAVLCGANSAYVENVDETFLNDTRNYYKKLCIVDSLEEAFCIDRICKVAVYDAEDAKKNICPHFKFMEDELQISASAGNWVDMMRKGVNKGTAIRKLKEMYGIDEKDCIAFGDYMNDYEMLKECYYSYAMENAIDEIKKICRFRAPSNNETGVVKVLKDIL